MKNRLDILIDQITTAAYGYEEQLWAFHSAFKKILGERIEAHVLGEPVQVDGYGNGGERRGLTAVCLKDGETWEISLIDVEFAAESREADLVDALRRFNGLKPASRRKPPKKTRRKKPKTSENEIEIGKPLDVAILAVKQKATRLRVLETGRQITMRVALRAAPGEIATVIPKKVWIYGKHPYMSVEEVIGFRLDVPSLGLTPLKLVRYGLWVPDEHYWGEEDDPLEDWAKPIYAAGSRPMFEMEQVVPRDEPESLGDGPILAAIHARNMGDYRAAHKILNDLLAQDLRCLDAHAHLGNFEMDRSPKLAFRHYQAGIEIAKLSLGEDFNGVLPWGCLDNRPFLRCLHGSGLCVWRDGKLDEATEIYTRMLWLNPTDNLGARFLLSYLEAGKSWGEMEAAEAAQES